MERIEHLRRLAKESHKSRVYKNVAFIIDTCRKKAMEGKYEAYFSGPNTEFMEEITLITEIAYEQFPVSVQRTSNKIVIHISWHEITEDK